jgi:hypothetical protein
MPSKVLEMLAYWTVGNLLWIVGIFLNRIPIHRNIFKEYQSKLYFTLYKDAPCLLSIVWYQQSSENGLLSSAHAAWWADAVKDEPSPTSGHPVLLDQPRYTLKQIGYPFKGIVQRDGSG